MKGRPFRIAVSVEHSRGWGRRVCEGVCSYALTHPDWRITMVDDVLPSIGELKAFDGFLWSVSNECAAERLLTTGRPIVNLMVDGQFPATAQVGADHAACGELVVRHFLSRYFRHFAFCGWQGLVFSDVRLAVYREALGRVHFDCSAYLTKAGSRRCAALRDVLHERFALPPDAAAIGRWLRKLPKPVAVFCANDLRAWQLSEICWRAGLSVPKGVALLGADNDIVPCLLTSPSLSSVDTATFETGRRAAEVLDEILHGTRAADGSTVLVPPRGVEARNSTAVYAVKPPFSRRSHFLHPHQHGTVPGGIRSRVACRAFLFHGAGCIPRQDRLIDPKRDHVRPHRACGTPPVRNRSAAIRYRQPSGFPHPAVFLPVLQAGEGHPAWSISRAEPQQRLGIPSPSMTDFKMLCQTL